VTAKHIKLASAGGSLVLLGLAFFSFFTVPENELVIVTRFGKPARIVENSGLHLKLPGLLESVNRFDKRSDLLQTQPIQLLLGDKKPMIISCFVLWKINDPLLFFQSMGRTESAVQKIGDIVNSKLSIVLADYTIENIINTEADKVLLAEIEAKVTTEANRNSVLKYGIVIEKTGVQRLAYPEVVIDAVYQRMKSERTKEADKIRAEGQEVAKKTTVEADRKAREIKAEAEREALILRGEGDYQAMAIYTEAYSKGGEFFNFLKSLETYSTILGKDTTLIISSESELFKYLQLGKSD
jgi:membrane protease subunit HflC